MAVALPLCGCIGFAVHGAKDVSTEARIDDDRAAADGGDAGAQYRVGAAYCCSVGRGDLVHDNVRATEYLCRSARQGDVRAEALLGRIYAGDPPVGISPVAKARLAVSGFPHDDDVAAAWLTLAEEGGDADAGTRLAALSARQSEAGRATTSRRVRSPAALPCEWDRVFPSASGRDSARTSYLITLAALATRP